MQAGFLKKRVFFSCVALLAVQLIHAQPAREIVRRADSLFVAGDYPAAGQLFDQYRQSGQPLTDAMLLKLAYVNETQGRFAHLLYYLQLYYNRHPDEAVLRKMHDIATEHQLRGYETDDLNYFFLFFNQYGLYVTLILLLLGGYIFGVFWLKHRQGEAIQTNHKRIALLYLVGLLLLINLPERYQSGIVNSERVYLRRQPASAAPVAIIIGKGHKVNIFGSQDIWLRVYWNDGLYYIRRDQVWEI